MNVNREPERLDPQFVGDFKTRMQLMVRENITGEEFFAEKKME